MASSTQHDLIDRRGTITLILGPMCAGKTSEMFRLLDKYEIAGKTTILIKYDKDTRYNSRENEVITHNKNSRVAWPRKSLLDAVSNIVNPSVIGIDEGQFFEDLPEFCEEMVNKGKIVIVSALSGDYQRKPWPVVSAMIPLADEISFLKAICMHCKEDKAAFSHRIGNETSIELIGGTDKYEPLCGTCYGNQKKSNNPV